MLVRFLVQIVLTAVLFCFVFPEVAPGVKFHGEFWPNGVIWSTVFAMVSYGLLSLLHAVAKAFVIGTLGLGLIILLPIRIFGFWLIPALQLAVFAALFPQHLSVASGISAIWAGLLLLFVNALTMRLTSSENQ